MEITKSSKEKEIDDRIKNKLFNSDVMDKEGDHWIVLTTLLQSHQKYLIGVNGGMKCHQYKDKTGLDIGDLKELKN